MAVAAVPQARRGRQSDLATQAVAIVPQATDAHARTMIATERTMIATTPRPTNKTVVATAIPAEESSCDIPIFAEMDDDVPVERPRARRQITVGDGVLQRVPQRKMWMVQAAIVLVGMSIGLAAFAGS